MLKCHFNYFEKKVEWQMQNNLHKYLLNTYFESTKSA